MEEKNIKEMTNEEILRQQLELLAEESKNNPYECDLSKNTFAMLEICKSLA